MENLSVEEKKARLSKIIIDLSKTQDILENHDNVIEYFDFLEDIYYSEDPKDTFRHYYSDIFGWISQIDNDYSEDSGNLEILSQNISIIKDEYERAVSGRKRNVNKSIDKLYDHINLEIARINYLKTLQSTSENQMQYIDQQVEFLRKTMDQEVSRADEVSKKINNAYSEFVSILGIFSAIVLVFFGGTSIFANIIAAMYKSSIYKSVAVCTITGVMVANIIFIFMCLLAKLLNRSIASDIPEWECYGNSVRRFRKRYPIIFYFNIFAVILLGITYFTWLVNKSEIFQKVYSICKGIIIKNLIVFSKKEILGIILACGIVVNIIFLLMYIFAKITDINIGWNIHITYPQAVYIQESSGKYEVYKDNWPEQEILMKCFAKQECARKYRKMQMKIHKIKSMIQNLPKRLFMRYRIIAGINILMIVAFIIVWNIKID